MAFACPEYLNIADYFLDARITEGRGDRVALYLDDGSRTYLQTQQLANRYGLALRASGVRQEERVLIALPDGEAFAATLFGVLKIGAVVVMVNPALEADRLAALFDYTRASAVVVHRSMLESFRAAQQASTAQPKLLAVGGKLATESANDGAIDLDELVNEVGHQLETVRTHRDDPAIWLFSGGTTGLPKAVVQTHRSFANTTELYAKGALGYSEDDVTLSVPKLFFGYATGSNLLFPFSVGAAAVLFPEHPTAKILFEKIALHRATALINVPTMINQMVHHEDAPAADLSSLRFATSAGEALPVPLYEKWQQSFGVELLDGLGTAEMWHIFISNVPGAVKPGTLGRVVPGFEIDVRDDAGTSLGPDQVGRLWARGDSRALGYWQNLDRTAEAFQGDWFVGGDLVSRDADGFVTYCGRSDDVLKVAGKWLAPQEVESCLMKHPSVAECAVVGMQNAEGLTKPAAFVRAKPDASEGLEEELQAFTLEHLQAYKHPRKVFILEDFPRTHLGKIDRGKLKTNYSID